jgi:hypothetical protein
MAGRPLVVLGDLHLTCGTRSEVSGDVAQLVRSHPGHEIVLNGDTFNLSHDPPTRDPAASLAALLRSHPRVRAAWGRHLRGGGPLTLVAGNHDQAVSMPKVRAAVLQALEVQASAPLRTAPWFVRRAGVHIEHGHVHDPDNAPVHPLAPWCPETEPLGVALTRRFVVPSGAAHFAHAHETTPLAGLWRTLRLYGTRGPAVVARYYGTAWQLWLEAGRRPRRVQAVAQWRSVVGCAAEQTGLSPDVVHALIDATPRPTHQSRQATFLRLYLDRSLAAGLAFAGLLAGVALRSAVGFGLAGTAAAYLVASMFGGTNRYAGSLEAGLRSAARRVAELSGARLVIFGHSHLPDQEAPHYLNPGSFAFPVHSRRGYAYVDERGQAEARHV